MVPEDFGQVSATAISDRNVRFRVKRRLADPSGNSPLYPSDRAISAFTTYVSNGPNSEYSKRHGGGTSHPMDLADRLEILRDSPDRNSPQRFVLVCAGAEMERLWARLPV